MAPIFGDLHKTQNQVSYDKQLSIINLSVRISTGGLRKLIEDLFSQTFTGDLLFEINKFYLNVKIFKNGSIKITESNGRLDIALPFKVEFRGSIWTSGTVNVSTTITLRNWELNAETKVINIDWDRDETVMVIPGPWDWGNGGFINIILPLFGPFVQRTINSLIENSLNIKKILLDTLETYCKPMELNRANYVWLGFEPVEVGMVPMVINNDRIKIELGAKIYLETSINAKPRTTFNRGSLRLTVLNRLESNGFNINIPTVITYAAATQLAMINFIGVSIPIGPGEIYIKNVAILNEYNKLIIRIQIAGSMNADCFLSAIPRYNPQSKEIYLDQIGFHTKTYNVFMKIAGTIFRTVIINLIRKKVVFNLSEQLQDIEKIITDLLYKNKKAKDRGINILGGIEELNVSTIMLQENGMVANIISRGRLDIYVD